MPAHHESDGHSLAPPNRATVQLDALIFGGGAAGLWLLAELTRRGHSVLLLEAEALGSGQTVASQGIIHGGLKYTLQGLLTPAARQIRDMPGIWRQCLAGTGFPNLSQTHVRSHHCHLWRTNTLASHLGMIGAQFGLRIAPQAVVASERPAALANCPGTVARIDEQVLSPASFIADLAQQYRRRILKVDPERDIEFQRSGEHVVRQVALKNGSHQIPLNPRWVVLTAGAGNARLREQLGLDSERMQRRPLHMVLARGNLPNLNGHCVDGATTRATITSDMDSAGRTVWQIGGQISEQGVNQSAPVLIAHARSELRTILPAVDFDGAEWSTYRVDRAEGLTTGGSRPSGVQILQDGNVLTAWPTKLALAPQLAADLADRIGLPSDGVFDEGVFKDWACPGVAIPPWEEAGQEWMQQEATGHPQYG